MTENEQIEEMARDLRKSEYWYFDDISVDFELNRKITAQNLYAKDYRKASEVAREIFEEFLKEASLKMPTKLLLVIHQKGYDDGVVRGKEKLFSI